MAVELRPLGVACNLGCTYCYQEPIRKAGNVHAKYDIDKMLIEAEKTGQSFHLFGGEILLLPKNDLERLLKRSFELFQYSGIQTNGTLIDEDHIKLFKKYNTNVGVSIDGPNELNGLREVRAKRGNTEASLKSTQTIVENMRRMVDNGISVSVIITLHRLNGSEENLPRLLNFIRWLGNIGIKGGNIHTLEVDKTMRDQEIHVLSQEDNIKSFIKMAEFFKKNKDLTYNPFQNLNDAFNDKLNGLICYWNHCDPANTQAVYGIEGDGALSNCGRTNKEGIDWYKDDNTSYERYVSLYHTPPELNGCNGCRYWVLCGGSCPGEAIDGDFRNKTIHCATQKAIIGFYEKDAEDEGRVPFTKSPNLPLYEQYMLDRFSRGESCHISSAIHNVENQIKSVLQIPVK